MYVKRVTLKNVKCFSDFTLEFPDPPSGERSGGWYVIVGPNGMGKSTILRAIALTALGHQWANRVIIPSAVEWAGSGDGWLQTDLRVPEPTGATTTRPVDHRHLLKITEEGFWGPDPLLLQSPSSSPGFVAGYGAFRRVGGDPGRRPLPAAAATLFSDDHPLDGGRWLIDADYRRRGTSDDAASRYGELVDAVVQVVNGGHLIPPGYTMLPPSPEGIRFSDLRGEPVRLEALGDGYRSAVGLVLALLRQLVAWQPADNGDAAGALPEETRPLAEALQTATFALIDEPDAHLHPSWQREIGFALQRVFPNMQFIVATHSPFICQAASPGGIFQLRMNEEEKRIEVVQPVEGTVRGWHIQDIYREALGLDNWLDAMTAADLEEYQDLAAAERAGPLCAKDAARLAYLGERLHDVLAAPGQTPEWREEYRRLRKLRERLEAKVEGADA